MHNSMEKWSQSRCIYHSFTCKNGKR
uniref:Uncharacterized protein n=1 Tax=Rhizophora mucronata TaxID=61149 RepID=A0A2P2MZK1_RHIMU